MANLLIIGATSAIAHATARRFAAEGTRFFLVGRSAEKLNAVRDDLRVCGAREAETYALDLTDIARHAAMLDAATAALGTLDMVLIAHGSLSDQAACEASVAKTNTFTEGLRGRLSTAGVAVVTIKPGFVDTPMTAHLPKNFLFVPPERIAQDVHRAMTRGASVVYTPWFWRSIMLLLRAIPDPIFRKLPI
ncbi:MAG: SDR family NAD(P)-dependent oxidoreductase [Thermomicrobia bacterium]|nr:SDR family NAD(P)-dependent oxidoreductase [Thermomicrobia bacterium]